MKRYVVYEPRDGAPRTAEGAEKLVFVREGFSWAAFLFAPLWLLWRRAWRGLIVWLALAILAVAMGVAGIGEFRQVLLTLLVNLVVGFEAAWFRNMSLTRRGYRPIAVVAGASVADAERAFFAEWDAVPVAREPAELSRPGGAAPRYPAQPRVLGLFPEPGASR